MGRFALFAFALACLLTLSFANELDAQEDVELDVELEAESDNAGKPFMDNAMDLRELRQRAEAAIEAEDAEGLQEVITELESMDKHTKEAYLDLHVLADKLSALQEDDEMATATKIKSQSYLELARDMAHKESEQQKAEKKARRIERREKKRMEEAARAKETGDDEKAKKKKGRKEGGGPAVKVDSMLLDGTLGVPALAVFATCLVGVALLATKLGETTVKPEKPGKARKAAKEAKKSK